MAVNNVAEGLEPPWEERLGGWLPSPHEWSERPVAGDARMQAHEWLRTSNGYVKTDAFDHYDDHFFPGCQDIAWDVAGAVYELDLDLSARRRLVERYRALSGDRTVGSRLPQYAACYLAYRLGYTSLASSTLGSSPDGLRFSRANDRYARLLRQELTQGPRVSWDV
jgi:hypothetical protein